MTYHSNHHFYGDLSNLNAPYDAYPLQGVGSVTWEGKTIPSLGYPWRVASSDTLDVQFKLNTELAKRDLCPLLVDGDLGPRTCGAMLTMEDVSVPDGIVATCAQHAGDAMEPKHCPGGVPPAPPEPEPPIEEETTKSGEIPVWVWGLGVGVLAVGIAIASKKKKRGK